MTRTTPRRRLDACSPILLLLGTAFPAAAQLPQPTAPRPAWNTAATHPGDPRFKALDYPVVFVSTRGYKQNQANGQINVRIGQDVIASNNPAPSGEDGGLHVLMPGGRVHKLFPLPVHEQAPGLIDTPLGGLGKGTVVEPNVSEDGTRVHFAYFHDQTWKYNGGGWLSKYLSYKGSDLYTIDLAPLLADPTTPVDTLPVQRLTFKEYGGPAKQNVKQTDASKFIDAINPQVGATQNSYWGTVDMHMVEMRTHLGPKAVWATNRLRVGNSNPAATDTNHNISLFMADLLPDGSLGPFHQFQYYTTTSAVSPVPLRDGITFSYQSSTEAYRRWDLQVLTSNGRWSPLLGYAQAAELFHLGSLVTLVDGKELDDHFLGVKYYNQNDGGFGQLHDIDMDMAGINTFEQGTFATTPEAVATLLTPQSTVEDQPSAVTWVDGEKKYVGKFSSPRAGRIGGEFLATWTPTSANRWIPDDDGETGKYDSQIVYRPNLEPFLAWDTVDLRAGKGLQTVVDEASGVYNLAWPTPLLSWQERHGKTQQDYSPSVIDTSTDILPGEPFALVGTSAIWNTDIRPYDCWLGFGNVPYNPNAVTPNEETVLEQGVDTLRYVQDASDFCNYLLPETVLGIQLNMTSNQVDLGSVGAPAYETDGTMLTFGGGTKEATQILGLFSPGAEGYSDESYIARIPADVPFDFHLLDSTYGMKLVDVRSWHSLQPREVRTDCGGCHQHEAGMGIPFEGTDASFKAALDMTTETKFIAYDPDCKPTIQTSTEPAVQVPEWRQDIWPEFAQHCGACHDNALSRDAAALLAFDYDDEESAYETMRDRHYASSLMGALGSPAFWAAYGERTDGRDNSQPEYQPDYAAGTWGYYFSSVHATDPGLCAASNPAWADWVQRLGLWIDNHMPRELGSPTMGYHFDRFHPTVDFAYSGSGEELRVGFWDSTDGPLELRIEVNGQSVLEDSGLENGEVFIDATGLAPDDVVRVVVTDPAGNRQVKQKTVFELLNE
jgi:hypothetical protein